MSSPIRLGTHTGLSTIPKLLVLQPANRSGVNIQGDEDDPLNLTSFQMMPAYATNAMDKLGTNPRFLLVPIFEDDFEEPDLIVPANLEIGPCPSN